MDGWPSGDVLFRAEILHSTGGGAIKSGTIRNERIAVLTASWNISFEVIFA